MYRRSQGCRNEIVGVPHNAASSALWKIHLCAFTWGKGSEIGRNARIYNTYFILVYWFLCNFSWLRVNMGGQSRRGEPYARCDMRRLSSVAMGGLIPADRDPCAAATVPHPPPPAARGNIPPPVATGASQQTHKRKRGNFILVSGS